MYADWSDVEPLIRGTIPAGIPDLYTSWVTALAASGTTPANLWTDFFGSAIDSRIDSYCRRPFGSFTEEIACTGYNEPSLILPKHPIQAVSKVTIRALADLPYYEFTNFRYVNKRDSEGRIICTAADAPSPQVQIHAARGFVEIMPAALPASGAGLFYPFLTFLSAGGWWENVIVNCTYGYTDANRPAEIRYAAAVYGAADFVRLIGGFEMAGATSVHLGPESRSYAAFSGVPGIPGIGYLAGGPYASAVNPLIAQAGMGLQRWVSVGWA